MKFKDLYNNLLLEFSEGAIKKLISKFSDTEEQTVRFYLDKFEIFKNALEKKDPFQYKTFTELEQAVDAAEGKRNVKKGDQKKVEIDVQQDDIVAEDDNVVIYRGDSQDKCVLYGRGYTFCISRSAGGNMYSNYRLGKESTFYFIYFKKKPVTENDHIMVLDHTKNGYEWTFKNNNTRPVSGGWDEIVSKYPELKPYEKLLVNKKLDESEKTEVASMRDLANNPTLEKFKSVGYSMQSKFLKSIIDLPDDIFDVLDSYLINEFLSIGPNLTMRQANSLKDSQIQRYIKTREQSLDQIESESYYNFNKHDLNIPKIKNRIDEGQKTAYERIASGNFDLSGLFILRLPDNIPSNVDGIFNCRSNNLTSLEGAPSRVREFSCGHNNLTSLEGAPSRVENFYCSYNNLTSLEGAPSRVGGNFYCSHNNLTSLKGSPNSVGRNFNCYNNNVTSLEGAPNSVGRNFNCASNNLTSLKGIPARIGRDVSFEDQTNGKKFTTEEIQAAMADSKRKQANSMLKEHRKFTQIELLENLRDWFAPHVDKKGRKFKGWINCKTGGPCGRNDTSKGSYPACRATKAACDKIKGKMYKKKSSKRVSWKKPKKKSE